MSTRRVFLNLLFLSIPLGLFTQTDSARYKLTATTVEFQILAEGQQNSEIELAELRNYTGHNELLGHDFTTAERGYGSAYRKANGLLFFPATLGTRTFFRFGKKNQEMFAGIRFGMKQDRFMSRIEFINDTAERGFDPALNLYYIKVDEYIKSYYFHITSSLLQVPVGMQITGNRNRRIWLSAGIEFCPGIQFAYKFKGYYEFGFRQQQYHHEMPTGEFFRDGWLSLYNWLETGETKKHLKGVGFNGYLSLPTAIHLRPLKRLSAQALFAMGYMFADSRYISARSSMIIVLNFGLMYKIE